MNRLDESTRDTQRHNLHNLILTGLRDSDLSFVHGTWGSSYRHSVQAGNLDLPEHEFQAQHWPLRRMILARPSIHVLVARDSLDPYWVFAYGIFERLAHDFVAHWLYTRKQHKCQGVARLLLATALQSIGEGATQLVATHRTYIESVALGMGFTFQPVVDLYRSHSPEQTKGAA